MMAQRQGGNPEFSFLHGGPGHEYYAWALYCALNGLNVSKPPSTAAAPRPATGVAATQAAAQPQVQAAATAQSTADVLQSLPKEVSSGWQQVLALLNGSRDSIRQSSDWFIACAPYAAGMAELMVQVGSHPASAARCLCFRGILCVLTWPIRCLSASQPFSSGRSLSCAAIACARPRFVVTLPKSSVCCRRSRSPRRTTRSRCTWFTLPTTSCLRRWGSARLAPALTQVATVAFGCRPSCLPAARQLLAPCHATVSQHCPDCHTAQPGFDSRVPLRPRCPHMQMPWRRPLRLGWAGCCAPPTLAPGRAARRRRRCCEWPTFGRSGGCMSGWLWSN